MSAFRALATGALVGLLSALVLTAPAAAAPSSSTDTPPATVTGHPWSAPTYPVTCIASEKQVSCTPDAATDIRAQQCFLGVLLDGNRSTVCTTYEAHRSALHAAGGKEVKVGYGCSVGDVVCVTFENAGRGMALATTAMMFSVSQNLRFDTSTLLWDAAAGEWSC